MAYFAVLNGNIVENVIVCDSKSLAEEVTEKQCIQISSEKPAGIGYIYDETNDVFTKPTPALEG